MDTNNIHDRLKLYELALADYEASLGQDENYKEHKNTESGFCVYFSYSQDVMFCYKTVPELHKQKPMNNSLFWFKEGEIQPRIDCLKRAIELTKSKIWEQS